jgi:phenylalanyl-tRNA synthetase beta chain
MKLNTEWLKEEFGINLPDDRLIKTLTGIGFEVESITNFNDYTVIDVNVTPNRGDCMSHLGIARELFAVQGKKLRQKAVKLKESKEKVSEYISVKVLNKQLCLRYCARIIRNVRIQPSPDWLKIRLESVGIRSINNVVDVTNYILMALGHPLHAFDLDRVKGNIIIRTANNGEKIQTLDGVERVLSAENLVIADEEKPIALAGVMGGANTEVSESTTNILLEAAVFLPESIQKTSRELKIETESSIRFSRGVDYEGVIYALDYAAEMIQNNAGGEILNGFIDIIGKRKKTPGVIFSTDELNSFLGTEIKEKIVLRILNSLNFKTAKKNKNITAFAPSYRNDISCPADIYEEVARHFGYDRIPLTMPVDKLYRPPELRRNILKMIREKMQSMGFMEVITYSFINPDYKQKLSLHEHIEPITLLNPLSQERSVMRPLLLPGMFESAEYNINHGNSNLKLFEIGRCFHYDNNKNCIEEEHLCGLIAGFAEDEWYAPKRQVDFYDAKGIIEEVFRVCNAHLVTEHVREPYLIPGASVYIFYNGEQIGIAGEVMPEVREKFGINTPCVIFELNISNLINSESPIPEFKQIPRLLALERDISLIVDRKVPGTELINAVLKASPLINGTRIFDVYEGKNIQSGRKSIGIRIKIQPVEKNLTDNEIDNIILNAVKILEKEFNAELRGTVYDKGRDC